MHKTCPRVPAAAASLIALAVALAWAAPCHAADQAKSPDPESLVPNGRMPVEGVLTGGQPSPRQLKKLADLGYRTIINMRLPEEEGNTDPRAVSGLGMDYVSLPLAGSAGINEKNARALAEILERSERPVLIHCASGNRIGAIMGLKAHVVDGLSPEKAMEVAKAAGITRLEPRLRELLGLPPSPSP